MRSFVALGLLSVLCLISSSASAALQGRDLDPSRPGYEAWYDGAQNLTWLADADYAFTSGRSADGRLTFGQALSWAAQLELYGLRGWRLPVVRPVEVDGCIAGHYSIGCGFDTIEQPSELWNLMNRSLAMRSIYLGGSLPTIVDYQAAAGVPERVQVPGVDPGVRFDNVMPFYWVAGLRAEVAGCPTGAECVPGVETTPAPLAAGGYWSSDGQTFFRCLFAAQCAALPAPEEGILGYADPPAGTYFTGVESVWPWRMEMLTDFQEFAGASSITANVWLVRTGDVAPVPEPATWVTLLAGLAVLGAHGARARPVQACARSGSMPWVLPPTED